MFSSCSIAGGAARFSSPPAGVFANTAAARDAARDDATRGVNAECGGASAYWKPKSE